MNHQIIDLVNFQMKNIKSIRKADIDRIPLFRQNLNTYNRNSKDIQKYVATPQREWLKGPLFKEVMDLISNGLLVKHTIIKFSNFQRLYNNYHSSKILGNSFFIWKIINLEFFMQHLSN